MSDLADQPAPESPAELSQSERASYVEQLDETVWTIKDDHLVGTLEFEDFEGALTFASTVGAIADDLWHHPELRVTWGELEVDLQTHDIGGLSTLDFIMAARIERAYREA